MDGRRCVFHVLHTRWGNTFHEQEGSVRKTNFLSHVSPTSRDPAPTGKDLKEVSTAVRAYMMIPSTAIILQVRIMLGSGPREDC
jgi:hypothetical protein